MSIRESYNNWPLTRQLQVSFITSGFILLLIIVIITKFQLDWLQSQVIENSTTVINANLLIHMHDLGVLEANYLTVDLFEIRPGGLISERSTVSKRFANDIATVLDLSRTDSIILGFGFYSNTSPFLTGTPIDHSNYKSGVNNYTTGCFMSSNGDAAGFPLSIEDTPMDQIYPFIYNYYYLGMYQGYKIEKLTHYYPAHLITDHTYSPLVREWYYKAAAAPGSVVITEPYIDSDTGLWVVTVSTALIDLTHSVFGVAGVDITLQLITERIRQIQVLEQGFALLVSEMGMVLAMPPSWGSTTNPFRIFDTARTGITEAQWTDIQALGPEDSYQFSDVNGTSYILTKNDITPLTMSNATHYVLLCANLVESLIPVQQISDNYSRTYKLILYITIAIGICVLIVFTVLVYPSTRKLRTQLKMIEEMLSKQIKKVSFPTKIKRISCAKLKNSANGIESLVDSFSHRIQHFQDLEISGAHFNWGYTKPYDELLFSEWNSCLYPYNFYSNKEMKWRGILNTLS